MKGYLLAVALAMVAISGYGIMVPELLSAKSDFVVAIGLVLAVLLLPWMLFQIGKELLGEIPFKRRDDE